MQIASGVEWAAHACILLSPLPDGHGLRAGKIAQYLDVPPAYMAKQLQLLSATGLIASLRGPRGGYRLAKSASAISLWDVHIAIEGGAPFFRCTEVRQRGPCAVARADCRAPCGIAKAFAAAQLAYREVLQSVTIADMVESATRFAGAHQITRVTEWYAAALKTGGREADV